MVKMGGDIMKAHYYTIVFAIAILCLSCNRKEIAYPDATSEHTYYSFSCEFEESPISKVYMEEGGILKWDIGDVIYIFSDTNPQPQEFCYEEDGKFYGEGISGKTFYAYYSAYYSDATRVDDNNHLRHKLLNSYPALLKGICPVLMIAKGDGEHLKFRQTGGLLHFSVKWDESVKSVFFEGNNHEIVSGMSEVDFNDDAPVLKIDTTEGGFPFLGSRFDGLSNVEDFYLFLPPMVLENGFTLSITTSSGKVFEKSTDKEVSISRARIISYSVDVDKDLEEGDACDRTALIALYKALDGDHWLNNSNWCTDEPLDTWFGITKNLNGRVSSIELRLNGLNGEIPEEIGSLTGLEKLVLSSNNITGTLPDSFSNLENLLYLHLANNRMTGAFPEQLRNLKKLVTISLTGDLQQAIDGSGEQIPGYDYFTGPIPEWISELSSLSILSLGNNNFSGDLPESLKELSQLRELRLAGNSFTGTLPDISKMENLYFLSVGHNFFTGEVPPTYANMMGTIRLGSGITNKKIISLGTNCLSGPLPDEILKHPLFCDYAADFLHKQRPGYKLEVDDTKIPACYHTFESFDGTSVNLGELYKKADYTLIVRWSEQCPYSEGFLKQAIPLAHQYESRGLQSVWAYAGGYEAQRVSFMKKTGLDEFDNHIIEYQEWGTYYINTDHLVWNDNSTPFVEIVNNDGNIVFVDDFRVHNGYIWRYYDQYSFSHRRDDLGPYLAQLFGEGFYESTDYSADGQVHTLQTATKGAGINVVLMGDAFSDRLIADGTYESVMRSAANALFSEEPYKSFKDYFNVYYVDVVSKNEVYYGDSALDTWYGDGTSVGGDNDKVFEYAGNVLSDEQIDDALMIVMMNRDYYAGTCYMYSLDDGDYGRGPSVSYFPTSSDSATFDGLVSHEAGGHGFAKLADEYAYQSMGTVPQEVIEDRSAMFPYGWWRNADFTGDPALVKWSQFISDSRYEAENIGTYEGAFTYWTGAWRPTEDSIMNHNVGGFNAPSRYAIWYRINKLAYGPEWQGTYEDFVEFDKPNRTPEAIAKRKAQRRNYVEKDFVPLAPPVVIEGDWRKMAKR